MSRDQCKGDLKKTSDGIRSSYSFSEFELSKFEGRLARKLRFHIFHCHFFRDVSHESFVFRSSTVTFWGRSRTKASFSHLQLSVFEGSVARKLCFHIFSFQLLREVLQDSFVFTSSAFRLWGRSRTKASFSHLQLSGFEGGLARKLSFTSSAFRLWGRSRTKASFSHLPLSLFEGRLARKLRFHIFSFQFLREVLHEIRFWEIADARNALFCSTKRVSEDGWGSLSGGRFRDGSGYARIMVGSATHWNCEFRRRFADILARSSIACCNSVFANRIGMAASRLLGAGAACVILLSFAAGHRKSYWCGCPRLR